MELFVTLRIQWIRGEFKALAQFMCICKKITLC